MPAALWLIALPLGVTPLVYLLRRSGAGAILAALVAFFLAWLVVRLPLGVVLNVLGRTIELDQLSQVTLSLLFATAAALFFTLTVFSLGRQGARRDALYSKSLGPEVRIFYPAVLVILALFVAANLFRHLGITAIFIELAAILTVFVIQTERLESTRAALRFLILISLATPLFLLAAWHYRCWFCALAGRSAFSRLVDRHGDRIVAANGCICLDYLSGCGLFDSHPLVSRFALAGRLVVFG
jgi:hypothetical protein